ncbi:hypothetical protein TRFO_39419 [Tritrichomonas foetus]|uniref:Right handed beta helix domain-containing protein n=1 Tax=Tritrichomonas foetus TaxID=1144522 RepID=A0A1J4JAB2_9EUKA|nr:hypothetical protein TRFO_39419 [Tritrichomonas foetus]|eukprot:OHS94389.1 hypothetical protein TRFO_39419 [Tritrichomonas foetus]
MFFFLFSLSFSLPNILAMYTNSSRCEETRETILIENSFFSDFRLTSEALNGSCISLTYCVFNCIHTQFENCSSLNNGGAVYFYNQKSGGNKMAIECCSFVNCSSKIGGVVYSFQSKHEDHNYINCFFIDNKANESGGAVYCVSQSALLQNCTFVNNISPRACSLFLENTAQSNIAWANKLDLCKFEFSPKTSDQNCIEFKGTNRLKPIEISSSCFFTRSLSDSPLNSVIFILSENNIVQFEEYNAVNGSEDTLKITNKIENGEILFESSECIIKEYFKPTKSLTLSPAQSPTLSPAQTPIQTQSEVQPTKFTNTIEASPSHEQSLDSSIATTSETLKSENFKENKDNEYKDALNKLYLVAGSMGGAIVLVIIIMVIIVIVIRRRNSSHKYYGFNEDEDKGKERRESSDDYKKHKKDHLEDALKNDQLAHDIL